MVPPYAIQPLINIGHRGAQLLWARYTTATGLVVQFPYFILRSNTSQLKLWNYEKCETVKFSKILKIECTKTTFTMELAPINLSMMCMFLVHSVCSFLAFSTVFVFYNTFDNVLWKHFLLCHSVGEGPITLSAKALLRTCWSMNCNDT